VSNVHFTVEAVNNHLTVTHYMSCSVGHLVQPPTQLAFSSWPCIQLPTVDILLSASSTSAMLWPWHKHREVSYMNHDANEHLTLRARQTVHIWYDKSNWCKAKVAHLLPHQSNVQVIDLSRVHDQH